MPQAIGLAIIGIFGSTSVGVALAVGNIVIGLATSLVLSGVAKLLQKKPAATIGKSGSQLTVRQPITPWRVVYGSVNAGGAITYLEVTGTDREYLHLVLTMAAHKVHAMDVMYFDGEALPLVADAEAAAWIPHHVYTLYSLVFDGVNNQQCVRLGTSGSTEPSWSAIVGDETDEGVPRPKWKNIGTPVSGTFSVAGKYAGYVTVEKSLGTDSQAAFPGLVADSDGLWTTNHRQRGRACAHVRLRWSPTKFTQGVPNITFDIQGKEVVDPRLSPPTAIFSDNPALCIRDYLTDAVYGLAAKDSEIDDESFIAAANICEEEIELRDSGSPPLFERRYSCNGTFDTDDTPANILQALLSSCAGRLVYSNGTYKLFVGAYRTPNTITVTEDDFRKTITAQTRAPKRDTFNGVKGLYISPINKWQPSDFPLRQDATYLAEDQGEVRWKDLEYQFTTSMAMAQRLAKTELERNRRQVVVSLPCKFSRYDIAPLDVIKATNTRFGWTDKTFEVMDVKLAFEEDDNGAFVIGVDVQAQETDANVYAWDPDADETIVDEAGVVVPPTHVPVVTGQSNRAYRPLTNPLTATDAGGSPGDCTINVDDFTMRIAGLLDTPYDSGAITGLEYGTLYYVYFDDPQVEGGTVTYEASTTKEDAIGNGRFFLGSCVTPYEGGPDNTGTNDGGVGSQSGRVRTYRFVAAPETEITTVVGTGVVTNPYSAIDGSSLTYAELQVTGDSVPSNTATIFFQHCLPSIIAAAYKVQFKVRYSVPTNSLNGDVQPSGVPRLKIALYNVVDSEELIDFIVMLDPGVTQSVIEVTHNLDPNINIANIQPIVQLETDGSDSSGDLIARIYDMRVEVTE